MTVRRAIKWTAIVLVTLLLALILVAFLVVRALVEPDASKFGKVKDEAALMGLTRADFKAAPDDYFARMDKGLLIKPATPDGYPAEIVTLAGATGLDPEVVREHAIMGQNSWIVWTGGNDRFWDYASGITAGAFDLLKIVSSHPSQGYGRKSRWRHLGLTNEPCFEAPEAPDPDRHGLWLDKFKPGCGEEDPFQDAEKYPGVRNGARADLAEPWSYYGKPTGILGLRLFPNPDFDAAAAEDWDPELYYTEPDYYQRKELVRPYRVGMSCGFCHIGPNPMNPPADPENPKWENIASNPGAQYFWVDRIFVWDTRGRDERHIPAKNEHNFIYQLFHTNPPGSLDTSLVSTDYMNNPRTMNAVYSVGARLQPTLRWGEEQLTGEQLDNKQFQDYPQSQSFSAFWNSQSGRTKTARVLKDGSDSVGILGALNRVYLNIGLFSEEWLLHFRPIIGGQKISPIRIRDAVANSAYWGATEDQTADMAIFFLAAATPDRLKDLKDLKDSERHLKDDKDVVDHGKVVFAENCAGCHSSKVPDAPAGSGIDEGICKGGGNGPDYRECWDRYWQWMQSDDFKAEMIEVVTAEDFLDNNFLSTERRVPVDLLQTNACSPLATNALEGDIWDNFSSSSYKQLPPVGELTVHHPVSGGASSLRPLGNGRGYTRPASLVSLWTSAPYLLNNSVGHVDYAYTKKGYYTGPDKGGYSTGGSYGDDGEGGYGAVDTDGDTSYGAAAAGYNTDDADAGKPGYEDGYGEHKCPAASDEDPYLPCVDNRMRTFHDSIRKMLYPERRRKDTQTASPVPGYIYRTTAPSCVMVPKGYMPDIVRNNPGFFHWLADWAIDEEGNLGLGPLPEGFPINALVNTKLLPDHDEEAGLQHYWNLIKAGPTLLGTFKKLGGTCKPAEIADPAAQVRADKVMRESGFIDALVGLSKCPDYVVNRGHYFGSDLPDADKEALIAFLKRF